MVVVVVEVEFELLLLEPVLTAATAAAAAATNEFEESVRDEGRKVPDEEELPSPLDRPDESVDSFECLLLLVDE